MFIVPSKVQDSTEVGRAFLILFQKLFLNKVFLMIKIARELKFYTRMVTSGSKCQKGPKSAEKSHNLELYLVFQKNFCLG